MKTITASLFAVAITLGAVPAAARAPERGGGTTRAQPEERAASMFVRLDTNADGLWDAAEREAQQRTRFDRFDTDNDASLTFSEFAPAPVKPVSRHDTRFDGLIDEAELQAQQRTRFERLDTDDNGSLTLPEFTDRSNDAVLTRATVIANALTMFVREDADRDGAVTREERRAAYDALRAQQRGSAAD